MMFMAVFWLLVLLVVARWLVAPGTNKALPEQTSHLQEELERLREDVDRLSGQVERLLEEQSFLLRLLDEGEPPSSLKSGKSEGALPEVTSEDDDPTPSSAP